MFLFLIGGVYYYFHEIDHFFDILTEKVLDTINRPYYESLFTETSILSYQDKVWLSSLFKKNNIKTELIYRATFNGCSADEFHRLVKDQGPTISIVYTEFGKTFGGYASVSWESEKSYHHDPEAFIFSVSHRTIHE